MNENSQLYKSIKSLLEDANKILDPVLDINNKDYDEMLRRLVDVMDKNIHLISQMKDVTKMDDDTAANHIFNSMGDSIDLGAKKLLAISLMYAMSKMCDEIKKSVNAQYPSRYQNIALELIIDMTDFYNLYCHTHWDKHSRKNYHPFFPKVGRRSSLDLNDQREVIRSMFWMESVPNIENLSFRDIRPHIQIMIRQAIEMVFKQIIGYSDIVDAKNNRHKKFTQIAVKFLSNYHDKHEHSGCIISGEGWSITLNMPIKTLERLNTWCNNFTHNPFIVSLPIIYFAYDQYERFINKCISKPNYTITGEENMRAEFAVFVTKQDPKAKVIWPKGIKSVEPSVEMRIKAIKKNLRNIIHAFGEEFMSLLRISNNPLLRTISKLIPIK